MLGGRVSGAITTLTEDGGRQGHVRLSDAAANDAEYRFISRVVNALTTAIDAERDRFMVWIVLAFGAGAAAYFALGVEPSAYIGPLAVLAFCATLYSAPAHTLPRALIALLIFTACGFTMAKLKTEWVRAPVLKREYAAAKVTGYVEHIEPKRTGLRLTIRPHTLAGLPQSTQPRRIRVTISKRLQPPETTKLRTGSVVTLRATLKPPPGPVMPGAHDFARYAWFKQIGAIGYARSPPKILDVERDPTFLDTANEQIEKLRRTISKRINAVLPGETGAIAAALITGERGGISVETNEAYRGAGLYHILSISGLHMAIMGGAVFFAARILLALFPVLALNYPIKKWAAIAALIGAFGYLLISGGAYATIRSFIMIAVMFVAITLDRPALALNNLAIAAALILPVFPESILDPGFQMSFAAVTALISIFDVYKSWRGHVVDADSSAFIKWIVWPVLAIIISTFVASAAVTPFAVYHFNNAQHYAVLANLIAAPVCNLVIMPAALATLIAVPFTLEALPLYVMGFGIDVMTQTATWVASLPGATSHPPAMPTAVFAAIVIGGMVLLLVRHKARVAGLALIAGAIAYAPTYPMPDLLVSPDGDVIAMKSSDGKLIARLLNEPMSLKPPKRTTPGTRNPDQGEARHTKRPPYALEKWMERYGDRRPADRALANNSFQCDRQGCVTRYKTRIIALPNHTAAIDADCRNADILIAPNHNLKRLLSKGECSTPSIVISKESLARYGAQTISIGRNGDLRIKTARHTRGERPWTQPKSHAKRIER